MGQVPSCHCGDFFTPSPPAQEPGLLYEAGLSTCPKGSLETQQDPNLSRLPVQSRAGQPEVSKGASWILGRLP